jgi:drug/metabolite transporter (DMT)-like permease
MVVIAASLGSAFAFAVATTFKHVSAGQVPDAQDVRPSAVGRLVRATLVHPLWLAGIAADVVGLSLQVLALHLGALAVVQPLLVTGLLFSLMLRRRDQRRVTVREVFWAVVLAVCLAGFLSLAGTASSPIQHEIPDRIPALIAGIAGVMLASLCVVLSPRQRSRRHSAALIGVATGVIYAATAALLKAVTDIATTHGLLAVFTHWQLYAVVVVGGLGLLLSQLAFQAGPLTASLPAIATVDPLLSIVVGVLVYDEQIRRGPLAGFGLLALLLVLGVSVIQLGKVDADLHESSDQPRDEAMKSDEGDAAAASSGAAVPILSRSERVHDEAGSDADHPDVLGQRNALLGRPGVARLVHSGRVPVHVEQGSGESRQHQTGEAGGHEGGQ